MNRTPPQQFPVASPRSAVIAVLLLGLTFCLAPQSLAGYYTVNIGLSTSASSLIADGEDSITLTATLTNCYGNPISGYQVVFDADFGDPSPYLATTNASGVASCTYKTVHDGSRTVEVRDGSDPSNKATQVVEAVAPQVASEIAVAVSPSPSGQFQNTTVTTTWTSTRTGKVIGYNKPYRIEVYYTSPGGTRTLATNSQKDNKSGSQNQSNVWGTAGVWTLSGELFVADRAKGHGVAWKSVATSSSNHTVN